MLRMVAAARQWGVLVRVLLSFNAKDLYLAQAFRASLYMFGPKLEVFFSPASVDTVLFEQDDDLEQRAPVDVAHADAFLLLVGPNGLGDWQVRECSVALARSARDDKFILVPVLAAGGRAPQGLACDAIWIEAPVVTDRDMLRKVIDALSRSSELADKPRLKTPNGGRQHGFWQFLRQH